MQPDETLLRLDAVQKREVARTLQRRQDVRTALFASPLQPPQQGARDAAVGDVQRGDLAPQVVAHHVEVAPLAERRPEPFQLGPERRD